MTFELEKTTPGSPPAAPRHLTLGGLKCAEKNFDFAPNRQKRSAKKIPTKMNGMKSAPKGRSSFGALPGSLFFPYTVIFISPVEVGNKNIRVVPLYFFL